MKDEEQRLIWSDGLSRPIPCSERSIQVKIARKIHDSQRQKKYLDGLYKVLAPVALYAKLALPQALLRNPTDKKYKCETPISQNLAQKRSAIRI